jgi:high-affinity Fe2+/Pb2+ permease
MFDRPHLPPAIAAGGFTGLGTYALVTWAPRSMGAIFGLAVGIFIGWVVYAFKTR